MYEQLPRFVREPDPSTYLRGRYCVLDVETTNREHGTALDPLNNLLLACWSFGGGGGGNDVRKAYWGSEFEQTELVRDAASVEFIICHNAKFELAWLKRCGVDLRTVLVWDTMIAEKVLAGNRKWPLSLDATAARRGLGGKASTVAALIKAGVCPSQIPQSALREYCEQDVALTEQLFLVQRQELSEMGLLPVMYCRCLVTPVLADIEFNGMTLDKERVETTHAEYTEKYASLETEFRKVTGGINPKSPKQMAQFIYGPTEWTLMGPPPREWRPGLGFAELVDHRGSVLKTSTGNPRCDKATLALLAAETPSQHEFKGLAVQISKLKVPLQNLKKMQSICKGSPDDPRAYANFNQTLTQTDRLSSSGRNGGFQFHNFDRAFKRLFRARKDGFVVCEADAPQLEFRVAAFLGNDRVAIKDICEGVDIHAATARTLGVSRQQAKAFTFRPLYGGNSGTARERKYFDYFRTRYASLYRTQSGWTLGVARDKLLVTPWGLRFYWPDTEIKDSGYVTNTTQIFNYAIQSLATADIIPLVLVLVWHKIAELGDVAFIVNTIHDSIVAEVSTDVLPQYTQILVESFTQDIYKMLKGIYGMDFTVPLGVGVKAGEHWGDGEEQKFEPKSVSLT